MLTGRRQLKMKRRMGGGAKVGLDTPEVILARIEEQEARRRKGLTTRTDGKNAQGGSSLRLTRQELQDLPPKEAEIVRELQERVIPEISQLQRRQRAKDDESIKKLADEFKDKTSVTIQEWVDRCENVVDPKTKKPLEPCPVDDPNMTCELTNKVFVREKGDTLDLGFCALPGTVKARVVSAVKQADVDRAERITTESRQMQDMLKVVVAQAADTANANCEVHNLRSACIGQLTGQQCVFNPYEDQDRLPGPGEALPTVPAHLDANPKPNDIGVCRATSNVVQDYYHRDQRELSQLRQRIAAGERFVRSNAQLYTVDDKGQMSPTEDVTSRRDLQDLYRSVVGRAEALKGEREREQLLVARVEKQKKIMQKLWLRHLTAKAYNDQCRSTLKVGDALETCNPVYVAGATQQCGVFDAKTGTWKNLNDSSVKSATATEDDICLNMQAQQVAWAPQLDVDGRSAGVFEIPNTGAYIVSGDRTHAPYYAALTVDDLQHTVLEKILQMMAVSYELARARHHALRAQKKPLTVAPKVQDDDAPRPGENLLRDPESTLLKGGGFRDKTNDVWFAAAPAQEGPLKILPEHIPTRAAAKEGTSPGESLHIRRLLAQLAALKKSVSLELERVENPMALALIRQIVNELGNQAPRGVRQELMAALGEVRMSLDHGAMSVYQSKLPDMLREAHATMRDLKANAQKANALFALAGQAAASNVAENVTPGAFNTVLQPGFVVGEMVRFYLPTTKQGIAQLEGELRRGVDMLPIPAVVLEVDRLGCPVWVAMYLNDSNSGAIVNEGGLLTPSLGNVFTRGLGNAVNVLRDSRSLRDRHTVLNSWLTSSNVVGNESSGELKSYIETLINKKGGNYADYVCVRVGFKDKDEMESRKTAGKPDTVYYTFPDGQDASDGQARIEKLSFNHGIVVSPDGCDSRATACQTDDWSDVRFNKIRDKVSSQRIMMPRMQYDEIIAARKKQAMGVSATIPIPFSSLQFPSGEVELKNKTEADTWNPIGVWQQFYTANPTLYGNTTGVKLLGGGGGSSGGYLPKYMKRGSDRLKTFEKLQKDWDAHLTKSVKCSKFIWQATIATLDGMFKYNSDRSESVATSVVTGTLIESGEWGNVNNSDESYNWEAYINALNQGRISSWRNAIVRSFIALPGIVNQKIRSKAIGAKKKILTMGGWQTPTLNTIDTDTNQAVSEYYAAQQPGDSEADKKIAEEESRRQLIAAWNAPWFAGQEAKAKTLNFTTSGIVPPGDARMYRDLDSFKLMLKCGMADDAVCHETLNRILKSLNVRAERRGFALKDFQATVNALKTMHMLGYLLCDVAAYAYQKNSDTDAIESTKLLYAETSEVLFEKAGVFGGLDGGESSQQNCWPEGSLMRLVDVASKHNVFMTTDSMAPDMGDALFCGALDTLPGDKSRSLNPNGGESYQQIWSIMSRELTRTDATTYSASRPAPRSALGGGRLLMEETTWSRISREVGTGSPGIATKTSLLTSSKVGSERTS